MRRAVFILSLISMSAWPGMAAAQEPPRTKEIKEAEKFITTAGLTQDTVERMSRLQRALNPLQQAATKDPDNARVWLLTGQVHAALHDPSRAAEAFAKAEKLYPGFGEEITSARMAAWGDAFNIGVLRMDAQKYDEAIKIFETAESIYPNRPESKMNLGALYANKQDLVKAEEYFRSVWQLADGPAKDKLKPEEVAQWKRFAEMGKTNAAQMLGNRGIVAFDAKKYDEAYDLFDKARAINPRSRDYVYNLAQTVYAQAADLEDRYSALADAEKAARAKKDLPGAKAKADSAMAIGKQLVDIYSKMEPLLIAARENDPNNQDLFTLLARSYRIRGELTKDLAFKKDLEGRVNALLKTNEAMNVELTDISVAPNGSDVTVKGSVKNRKLPAGTAVKVHFSLYSLDGKVVGEQDITVSTAAANASTPFSATIKTTSDLAFWRYVVTN